MATVNSAVYVPLEVYLETTYRPDRDWIDGEVKERNMGEYPHATVQHFLDMYLGMHAKVWGIRTRPELRVQTSAKHYRVPDLCVMRRSAAMEVIIKTPPLLCIEILSRDDRMSEIQERVDDYLDMGVDAVWVIDPRRRLAFSAMAGGTLLPQPVTLTVTGTPITVAITEMFEELNEMEGVG